MTNLNNKENVYKVLIIGSGPASYTAALYTSRADLSPILFAGEEKGGQLMTTTEVENYPGFPEGITGPELMVRMEKQVRRFGTEIIEKTVTEVDFSARPFSIFAGKDKYLADTVIIGTGSKARYLGLENEQKLIGRGVSGCATCDGFFFRDKEVVVIGGGDSACTEALFLTRFCSKVTMIVRRDQFRASKIMQDKVFNNDKVDVKWNVVVEDVLDPAQDRVTHLVLKNTKTGELSDFPCQGMFLGIGHSPQTGIFKGQLDLDDQGYIITDRFFHTNVPGIFAAGDVQDSRWRQAITSAGSGSAAALEAEKFLETNS